MIRRLALLVALVLAASTFAARAAVTQDGPINGHAYSIAADGRAVRIEMCGVLGDHAEYRVRIYRVGWPQLVFRQTSVWLADRDCEAISSTVGVDVGGYYWYVDLPATTRAPRAAGVFVVQP